MSDRLRILLVEDSEPDAVLVQRALKDGGLNFEVYQATNRQSYVEALESEWDLILCGHTLPDLNAPEALALAGGVRCPVPFIVVSGTIDEETAVSTLAAGAVDYVMKSNLRRLVPALRMARARADEHRQWLASQSRLRLLSEAVEQGGSLVIITDAAGRIEYVNARFEEVSGYALAEVLQKNPRILKGKTSADLHHDLWKTITAGHVWRGELDNRARSGVAYRVKATVSPVRDEAGEISHYVGIQDDISADHQRLIIEAALDGVRRAVWRMRRPEDLKDLQMAAEQALTDVGIPFRSMSINVIRSEAQPNSLVFGSGAGAARPPEPSQAGGNNLIRAWREAGQVVYRRDLHEIDEFEAREYFERVHDYPVRAVVDVPFSHGTLGVNSDIPNAFTDDHIRFLQRLADVLAEGFARLDDLHQLEDRELQLQQAQKTEAIGQLAGGIAHDFNNLLTVIRGSAQTLTRHLDGAGAEQLQDITRAADSAAALVRQLLTFSRREEVQLESVDLNRVIAQAESMLKRLLSKKIVLDVQTGEDIGPVRVDAGQMEQVVINLAINARDAMPEGGRLTITTSQVDLDEMSVDHRPEICPGAYALLTVADTGVGMDAQTQRRIFEPFFTTKEQGRGTGLGLSTVYGIVQQGGGFIWVHSEPGTGSTFKICLPIESADLDEEGPTEVQPERRVGHETT